jgi:hypothetical protein
MARPWIMIKEISGIEYAYLYRTIKEEGEFKNKMIRYLGRLDLLKEALDSVLKKREKRPIPRRKSKKRKRKKSV